MRVRVRRDPELTSGEEPPAKALTVSPVLLRGTLTLDTKLLLSPAFEEEVDVY